MREARARYAPWLDNEFAWSIFQEDADIHYYSNNRYNNHKQKGRIKNGEPGKDQEVVDYPFDDDEKENDFDPLSAPGEEEAKKVTVPKPLRKPGKSKGSSGSSSTLDGIQCDVNSGKYLIDCKQSADEVYIPFSFLRKYYEVKCQLQQLYICWVVRES